jgi:ADP-ribosylglycohydrolase
MESSISLEDRVFGVIFGHAVGDALGLGAEFMTKEKVRWHYPEGLSGYAQIIQDDHRKRWRRGDWTDDTDQMTMILDSLLELRRVDVRDIGRRFHNWVFHSNGQGVGNTVYAVLKHPLFKQDPHEAARAVWESTERRAAANGGVMRTSILGLWDFHDLARVRENAEAVCKITHFDPRCVASCVAVSVLVNGLVKGDRPDQGLLQDVCRMASEYDSRITEAFQIAFSEDDIGSLKLDAEEALGYTLKPVAAGLWGLKHAGNFDEGLLPVINEGGDADSNGAVVGALLGARYGFRGIPARLIGGLTQKKYLTRVCNELLAIISGRDESVMSGGVVLADEAMANHPRES